MFQLTRGQYESVLRTFLAVFPDTFVVRGDFYATQPIVGLAGGQTLAGIDWDRVSTACARLRVNDAITDPLVRHAAGVAMLVVGEPSVPAVAPLNTLANGWLEFDAGRNIIGLREPWFVAVPYATHLRELHRGAQLAMPEALRAAHDSGQFFLTLEIAAHISSPELPALKLQVAERLPADLRNDSAADWRQWPGRVKPDGLMAAP
jgi:hypothetical protein